MTEIEYSFESPGQFIGGSNLNFGFEKTLSADNRFSNEYVLSYFQKSLFYTNQGSTFHPDHYLVERNLGVSARVLFNHEIGKKSKQEYKLSFGIRAGINGQGFSLKHSYDEFNDQWSVNEKLKKSVGALIRFHSKKLFTQMDLTLRSDLTNRNIPALSGFRYMHGEIFLSCGIGYKFGKR